MKPVDSKEPRILVAEANATVLADTRRVLQEAGYEVIEAATGKEAVRLVRELRPDLVLMDAHLPGISGREAVGSIKADPDLAAIFVVVVSSGDDSLEEPLGEGDEGADGYIVRPVSNRNLLASVKAFIRHKKMGDALRASEVLFSNSFDHAPIGMTLVAPDGRWIKVNRAFCQLVGRSEAELLPLTIQDITHPGDLEVDREKRRQLSAGEIRFYQVEKRYVHRQGQLLTVLLKVSLVRDVKGGPVYLIAHIQDVTEWRRSEEQLRASLREVNDLKVALDEHAIVAITDPQGRITYANDKFCAISKYSREELLGQDHRIVNSGFHPKKFIRNLWETITAGRVWHGVVRNRAKDGSFFWTQSTIVPFLDEQGHPRQYVVIRADITALKKAENALRENEERLRFALETIHTGAWDLDLVDHSAFRSLEHDRIFGYPELLPEWTYEIFLAHVLPEDQAMVDDKFRRALQTHGDWRFECRIRRTDGLVRWIWAAGRHHQDASGAWRHMTGIIQDITDQKQKEENLRESEERHRALFASSRDAIMTVAPPSWRFTSGNPAAVEMFRTGDENRFTETVPWELSPEFQPDGLERSAGAVRDACGTFGCLVCHLGLWAGERMFCGRLGQHHRTQAGRAEDGGGPAKGGDSQEGNQSSGEKQPASHQKPALSAVHQDRRSHDARAAA